MDDDESQPPPEKLRFLLPDGCKDLIDALRLQESTSERARCRPPRPYSQPPIQITIPELMYVRDLAAALHLELQALVDFLSRLGISTTPKSLIDGATATFICKIYLVGVKPGPKSAP